MDATKLVVNVPAEMQDAVAKWQDGEEYPITIKQVGTGMFELVSVDTGEENAEPGADETTPKVSENPAINKAAGMMMQEK